MLQYEEHDPSDILVTAWADDDAIDWAASADELGLPGETDRIKLADAYAGRGAKCLQAKPGETITWFWFRLLTRREDIQIRTRYGLTVREASQQKDLPLAKIEAMALEAARLCVREIDGIWKADGDEPLPDKYIDARGPLPTALVYVGEKIIRFSRLTKEEADF